MNIWNSITAFFSRLWNGTEDEFPWTDDEFEARICAMIEDAERGSLAIRAQYELESG